MFLKNTFTLLGLLFFLSVITRLPAPFLHYARSITVDVLSSPFSWGETARRSFRSKDRCRSDALEEENARLLAENYTLRSQMSSVYEWLLFDARIEEQTKRLRSLQENETLDGEIYWREFFQRRSEELKNLLEKHTQALSAKVIYRQPFSWGSSLWINVGAKDNALLEREIVSKNSPVIVGGNLVGVVEYVSEEKSRVRLITDSGFIPSVRAHRGKTQDGELLELLHALSIRLQSRKDLSAEMLLAFQSLQKHLLTTKKDLRLAKGEIRGASSSLWSRSPCLLRGIGFNYDYADEEGVERDLRTGKALSSAETPTCPILKEGDLLVTTGLDGVFPEGLFVGIVTKVAPLEPGDFYYRLEAEPTCQNLSHLSSVFVLPPVTNGDYVSFSNASF